MVDGHALIFFLLNTVMFRIVEDDMPPIPDVCTKPMRDFLRQCFKKNPAERPSAEMLFEHPWLKITWGEHKVSKLNNS
jgi:serine/threonine protein kinase